MEDKYKNFQLE